MFPQGNLFTFGTCISSITFCFMYGQYPKGTDFYLHCFLEFPHLLSSRTHFFLQLEHIYLIFSPKSYIGMLMCCPWWFLMIWSIVIEIGIFHLVYTSCVVICCWIVVTISILRSQILIHYKPQTVTFFEFPLLLEFINGAGCSPSYSIIGILSQSLQSKGEKLQQPYQRTFGGNIASCHKSDNEVRIKQKCLQLV